MALFCSCRKEVEALTKKLNSFIEEYDPARFKSWIQFLEESRKDLDKKYKELIDLQKPKRPRRRNGRTAHARPITRSGSSNE